MDKQKIIFICHSLGGIVTRYMIEQFSNNFKDKQIGIVLIASPSTGSAWSNRLRFLNKKVFKNKLADQLQNGHTITDDLDRRFMQLIKDRRLPWLMGQEAFEEHFVFRLPPFKWWSPIVERSSAERYWPPARPLENTDHMSCVKPPDEHHPAHILLIDFWADFQSRQGPPNSPSPKVSSNISISELRTLQAELRKILLSEELTDDDREVISNYLQGLLDELAQPRDLARSLQREKVRLLSPESEER